MTVAIIDELSERIKNIEEKSNENEYRVVKLPKDMLVKKDENDKDLIFYYEK